MTDSHVVQAVLTVRRWRRYGADRLYVVSATGAPMGSVDLASGEVDVADLRDEQDVRRAAQEYLRSDVAELALPTQRTGTEGLSAVDSEMLAGWLGEPTPDARSRREDTTRQRLDRLGDRGWTVLHDVPVGLQGSVCEHLVLGPTGLFALSDRGRADARVALDGQVLLIDGEPTSQVRVAVMQARRVADLLRAATGVAVQVRPVLAVAGRFDHQPYPRVTGPLVLARGDIPGALLNLPEVLTPGAMSAIARAARRADTWSTRP